MTEQEIISLLNEVRHPARADQSINELGMVSSVEILSDNKVEITLAFPKKRDPLTEYLIGATRAALIKAGLEPTVKTMVLEEPVPKKVGLELGTEQLGKVKHIIGVASGKGGVGKSTVAVNLAVALARLGYTVGLADADVYGPSVPTMTGTESIQPSAVEEDGKQLMIPIEKFGVKWMSIGYFADRGQALIWRGLMACNALKQMILQVKWGELDFLLIDMPPGTGDIHISLVNDIPMEAAIVVTTPQNVALADVEKGVSLFQNKNVNKTILGIVENMAWFTPAEHPDEKYYLFGKDGGTKMAKQLGLDLLGQIPLVQSIREGGDDGDPVALSSRPDSFSFIELASRVIEKVKNK